MRKWILTKELFDSDELKSQNEVPYLQGNLVNSYEPLGVEKMNLNNLLLRCPFLMICMGSNHNKNHYATYEDGVYLFIFISDKYRCQLALDLKERDSIDIAFMVYKNPINLSNPIESRDACYTDVDLTMEEVYNFVIEYCLGVLEDYGFNEVIEFNSEINISRMN